MTTTTQRKLVEWIEAELPGLPIKYNVSWKHVTTLGIGEDIPLLVEPHNDIALIHLLKFCNKHSIKFFILGGGSNTVGSDTPYQGVVIKLCHDDFIRTRIGRKHITVGAGVRLFDFLMTSANHGLGGTSALSGIPGTIGGALRMNAGAHGVELGTFVSEVFGFLKDGTPWTEMGRVINWGYRSTSIPEDLIITGAIFKLEHVKPDSELEKIHSELNYRRSHAPGGRSAGSIFRNPSKTMPAGKLIDLSGLKGTTCGDIMVSTKHANYFINTNEASEEDFIKVVSDVRNQVNSKYGFCIKPEVRFVCEDSYKQLVKSASAANVTVLKGGTSNEREVSLESGAAVANALRSAGYNVTETDIQSLEVTESMKNADVVFPVLHGGWGENGEIQRLMEGAGINFVGSGSVACDLIVDKVKSKKMMDREEIPHAPYTVLNRDQRQLPSALQLPVVVKPPCEGSTVGIRIASTKEELTEALDHAFEFGDEALVEKYIKGVETTVGVIDGEPLPMVEIQFPGQMYDYDAKYTHNLGETKYLCPPESVTKFVQKKAQEIAVKFYNASGAKDLLRVDMILTDLGDMYVLEANNLPGFTSSSLLPKAAMVMGKDFVQLCTELVNLNNR